MQNESFFNLFIFAVFCNVFSPKASCLDAFVDYIIANEKLNRWIIGRLTIVATYLLISFIYKIAMILNNLEI